MTPCRGRGHRPKAIPHPRMPLPPQGKPVRAVLSRKHRYRREGGGGESLCIIIFCCLFLLSWVSNTFWGGECLHGDFPDLFRGFHTLVGGVRTYKHDQQQGTRLMMVGSLVMSRRALDLQRSVLWHFPRVVHICALAARL